MPFSKKLDDRIEINSVFRKSKYLPELFCLLQFLKLNYYLVTNISKKMVRIRKKYLEFYLQPSYKWDWGGTTKKEISHGLTLHHWQPEEFLVKTHPKPTSREKIFWSERGATNILPLELFFGLSNPI